MRSTKRQPELAVDGGRPVRSALLPYGRHVVDDDDIQAVVDVLRSDWLTTGPKVAQFEEAVAAYVGARHAVAFSSGTAALHAAAFASGLGPGDEAITTPLTFCGTSNCVIYQGARPQFADVCEDTLNLDPAAAAEKITPRTKAILPVDYAGHPADLDAFLALADRHGLIVIEDACHALGAEYKARRVGAIAHMTIFSFHPVKHVTTGEGGMVVTNDSLLERKLRIFRTHGIESDARERSARGQWYYEMTELGYNYRISDINCALGTSQMRKLDGNLLRRREIANVYDRAFAGMPLRTPSMRPDCNPAWHLYPVRLDVGLRAGRDEIFRALRAENIGVNVHYIPVHMHPYYCQRFGYRSGEFPVAESAFEQLISLPMFHGMTAPDQDDVVAAVSKVLEHYAG